MPSAPYYKPRQPDSEGGITKSWIDSSRLFSNLMFGDAHEPSANVLIQSILNDHWQVQFVTKYGWYQVVPLNLDGEEQ